MKVAERLMAIPVDVSELQIFRFDARRSCGLDRYQIGKLIYRPASLAPFWAGQGFQSFLYASRRLGRPLNRNVQQAF